MSNSPLAARFAAASDSANSDRLKTHLGPAPNEPHDDVVARVLFLCHARTGCRGAIGHGPRDPKRGTGYQITTRYGRTAGRTLLSITFDHGRRRLTPGPVSSAVESLTEDELRLSFRRAAFTRQPATGLALGVDATTSMGTTLHHYADPTQSVSDFAIGALTLGPSASWGQRVARGSLSTQFSIPLIGLVNHPYSDSRNVSSRVNPRFATFARLRGAAAGISYATDLSNKIGFEYAYRLRVLRYADVQPMRTLSQMFSVGLVTRLGARAAR